VEISRFVTTTQLAMHATSIKCKAHDIQTAFDLLPDTVLRIDRRSMTVVEANNAACLSLGYGQELTGMNLNRICPEEDMVALLSKLDAIPAGHLAATIVQTRQRRSDGHSFFVEWHVARVREDEGEQWLVVSRDLSARCFAGGSADETMSSSDGFGALGHDPLTGLPNRCLFEQRLEQALRRVAERTDYRFAICFIDMDNFKVINDTAGHLVGDRVLCEVASRLTGCVRPNDTVARFGGDEFTILLDGLRSDADAAIVAQRILTCLESPVRVDGLSVGVAASIGVAASNPTYQRAEDLLRNADRAMYRAKALGGGDLMLFDDSLSPDPARPR
jgi:diguanylate cyclase (GGDEF)-like protein/PAS domain S-box-containing protein